MRKTKEVPVDYSAKVIIVGDGGVGKTNILYRFCSNEYKPSLVSTIGVDFRNKNIDVEDKKIKLQLWDTAGQERFKNVNQTYFKGAMAVILTYSITNRDSFQSLESWIKQINENSPHDIVKFLVAAKCDLEYDRKVKTEEGMKIAKQYGLQFIEVSAKEGTNISVLFSQIGEKVLKILKKKGESNKPGGNRISLDKKQHQITNGRCKC